MVEIGLQREKVGHADFCAQVEKNYLKNKPVLSENYIRT